MTVALPQIKKQQNSITKKEALVTNPPQNKTATRPAEISSRKKLEKLIATRMSKKQLSVKVNLPGLSTQVTEPVQASADNTPQ